MSLFRKNRCDGCQEELNDNDKVVALIPNVSICKTKTDDSEIRLKLSLEAIDTRTIKVYCRSCLDLTKFQLDDPLDESNI